MSASGAITKDSTASVSSKRSPVTCHVLNTSTGRPQSGVKVELFRLENAQNQATTELPKSNSWKSFATGVTDKDGRCSHLIPPENYSLVKAGLYKMVFYNYNLQHETDGLSGACERLSTFYPWIEITFNLKQPETEHYHIPLLLSPFGYTTYRGS